MNFKLFTESWGYNDETLEKIYQAGQTQRGEPESKMLEACRLIQAAGGAPIIVDALEHIGDLADRASRENALINVQEKAGRFLRLFEPPKGWMDWYQEIEHGLKDSAAYRVIQSDPKLKREHKLKFGAKGRRKNFEIWANAYNHPQFQTLLERAKQVQDQQMHEYAETHKLFNKPITTLGRLGKDAAVALGERRYNNLHHHLKEIMTWLDEYEKAPKDKQEQMFIS